MSHLTVGLETMRQNRISINQTAINIASMLDEEKSTDEIQEEEIKVTKYKYIADDNKEDDCYIFQVPKLFQNHDDNKSDIKEEGNYIKPIYFQTENLKFGTYFFYKSKSKIDWILHLLSLPISISNISIQFQVVLVSKMECYSANITFTHNKMDTMLTFNDFISREDIINSKDLTFKIFIKTLETRNEKNELIYNDYKDKISWLNLSYLPSNNLLYSTKNKQLITAMKEYGAGNYKTTNIFDVKSLKFTIKIYPNGRTMDGAGKFCVELVLMTIPPKLSGISVILDAQLTGNGYNESNKMNHCYGTFNIIKPNEMSLCCDNICTFTEFQKLQHFQLNLTMIFVDIYDIEGVSVIDKYDNNMNDCKSLPISRNYYEWIPNDTKTILNACNTQYFESDIFELEGFKWRFQIFPNGYTPSHNGSFAAFLYLAALSPSICKIVALIRLRVYGEGIDSECISYSFLDTGEYDTINSKLGWITTGISDIAYLSGIHQFKFEITVLIIDVFDIDGNTISEYKRLQSPLQHSLSTSVGHRTWNIHNAEAISMLCSAKNGESFESGFFRINKLRWNIKIYPNGKISRGFEDGDVLLQIQLEELIKPIIALSFEYRFYMKETETWFTNIAHFRHSDDDYNGLRDGWTLSHCKTNKLKTLHKLTIKLELKLLEVYAKHNILMTHVY